MVFIPKKTDREVDGVRCCELGDARRLSIVSLLASAVRLRVEPMLAMAISPAQRGLLPGRSMLHNMVEVDGEMRAVGLQHERAAAVFFDSPILSARLRAGRLCAPVAPAGLSGVLVQPLWATGARSRPAGQRTQASRSGRRYARAALLLRFSLPLVVICSCVILSRASLRIWCAPTQTMWAS